MDDVNLQIAPSARARALYLDACVLRIDTCYTHENPCVRYAPRLQIGVDKRRTQLADKRNTAQASRPFENYFVIEKLYVMQSEEQ